MPFKLNKKNDSYNILFSLKDEENNAHHYIQKGRELLHFTNEELEDYLDKNRIKVYSPIPFIENDREI